MPLRFKDVKAQLAKAAGICEDDPRLIDYTNEAVETLIQKGKFKGTVLTFNFCLNANGCIVWPREIETIEAIALCKTPINIRSEWYEFAQDGIGILDGENNCLNQLLDRGEVVAFDEVTGSNKKLAVYADRNEGPGKYITLEFWDENGQWVRTSFNGVAIDGEKLQIPSMVGTYVYTTSTCKAGGLLRVSKDATLGIIRLYSYDTTTGELKPLAYYQPDETNPSYRSSLLPALADGDCDQRQVKVKAKARFIPIVDDNSWLMLDNLRALRLAVKAIKKEYDEKFDEAAVYMGMAERALHEQLHHHKGDGEWITPKLVSASLWGGGNVCNIQ